MLRMSAKDVLSEYRELEEHVLAAMVPDLTESAFSELALQIHAFQRRWNQSYDSFAAARPTPHSWREIPAVPQSAFKSVSLSCVPAEAVTTTFQTSGTTGEKRGHHHFLTTRLYDEAVLRGWAALGLPKAQVIVLAQGTADAPHSSLSHMLELLAHEWSLSPSHPFIDPAGDIQVDALIAAIKVDRERAMPVAIVGTALAFLHLFEQLGNRQLSLPAGSFAMETGGYKGSGRDLSKSNLYSQFTTHLGLNSGDVINEYGMTELSSQFYARGLNSPHLSSPWLRALVIDPESGREAEIGATGVLRLFDLANLNSVLAFETQDFAIRRAQGFELLGRDPAALPRGCSRPIDELLSRQHS